MYVAIFIEWMRMPDCIMNLIWFDKNNMMVQRLVLDNLNSFLHVGV